MKSPLHQARTLLLSATLFGSANLAFAEGWDRPYAPGTVSDQILGFYHGGSGTAQASSPPSDGEHIVKNETTMATATGGGWSLGAKGAVSIWQFGDRIGQARTTSRVSSNTLGFDLYITRFNPSSFMSFNLNTEWRASATIAESIRWKTETQAFRYIFDVTVNRDLLSLNPSYFNDITLTIRAGSSTLLSQTLDQLAPTLSSSNPGLMADFNYDPSLGQSLSIEWLWAGSINKSVVDTLGPGPSQRLFSINGARIETTLNPADKLVPEPGSAALLFGALAAGTFFRRRIVLRKA